MNREERRVRNVAHLAAERRAAGLPQTIADPYALREVARMLGLKATLTPRTTEAAQAAEPTREEPS